MLQICRPAPGGSMFTILPNKKHFRNRGKHLTLAFNFLAIRTPTPIFEAWVSMLCSFFPEGTDKFKGPQNSRTLRSQQGPWVLVRRSRILLERFLDPLVLKTVKRVSHTARCTSPQKPQSRDTDAFSTSASLPDSSEPHTP